MLAVSKQVLDVSRQKPRHHRLGGWVFFDVHLARSCIRGVLQLSL